MAKRWPVSTILTVHLWLGALVALLAVFAVWRLPGRRITIWVVTVQILIGIVLMVQGLRINPLHPALAVIAWGGYMASNAVARRQGMRPALIVAGIATLLLLITFGLGQNAVRAGGG